MRTAHDIFTVCPWQILLHPPSLIDKTIKPICQAGIPYLFFLVFLFCFILLLLLLGLANLHWNFSITSSQEYDLGK